jgi:hypothetical protein
MSRKTDPEQSIRESCDSRQHEDTIRRSDCHFLPLSV